MAAEIAPVDRLIYYSYFFCCCVWSFDFVNSITHDNSSAQFKLRQLRSANGGSSCLSSLYLFCLFTNATWFDSKSKKWFHKSPTPLDFRPHMQLAVLCFFLYFSFGGGLGHKWDGVGLLWNLFLCLLSCRRRLQYLSRKAFS